MLSVALLVLCTLHSTVLGAPVPEEVLQSGEGPRIIPTFESVDWVRSQYSGNCYDVGSEQFVRMGQSFYIGCGKCTCDRYGYWCVTKCPPVFFDASKCVEVESYIEDGCCKRKRCKDGITVPEPTTAPVTTPIFTTADAFSTETPTDDVTTDDITVTKATDVITEATEIFTESTEVYTTAENFTEGTQLETIPIVTDESFTTEFEGKGSFPSEEGGTQTITETPEDFTTKLDEYNYKWSTPAARAKKEVIRYTDDYTSKDMGSNPTELTEEPTQSGVTSEEPSTQFETIPAQATTPGYVLGEDSTTEATTAFEIETETMNTQYYTDTTTTNGTEGYEGGTDDDEIEYSTEPGTEYANDTAEPATTISFTEGTEFGTEFGTDDDEMFGSDETSTEEEFGTEEDFVSDESSSEEATRAAREAVFDFTRPSTEPTTEPATTEPITTEDATTVTTEAATTERLTTEPATPVTVS